MTKTTNSLHLLAKSDSQTLINHSENVANFAIEIGKRFLKDQNPQLIEIIKISARLHDIGKACGQFQKMLRENNENNLKSQKKFKTGNKFRHHEIGFAFLHKYLKMRDDEKEIVLHAVYYHHGIDISKQMSDHTPLEILKKDVTSSDLQEMKDFLVNITSEELLRVKGHIDENAKTPSYFLNEKNNNDKKNSINLIVRSCLISADRFVSNLFDNPNCPPNKIFSSEEINEIIDNRSFRKNGKINITTSPYSDTRRFDIQKAITYLIETNSTTIVNAPAGFGKTLLGILWGLMFDEKIIWVCPRNEIAISVFDNIKKELKQLNLKVSVELYLTREKVNDNHIEIGVEDIEDFNSDIIVTNIDNFEAPTIESGNGKNLFLINTATLIFDEQHELVGDSPLFGLFIIIMKMRHRYSNSRTLLLSATPNNIDHLWNSVQKDTLILPRRYAHYPAAHKQKIKFNVIDEIDTNTEGLENGNNLMIFNAISNTQIHRDKHCDSELYHSKFTSNVKKNKHENLMNLYGKDSLRTKGKKNVISSHLIQASLDISFLKVSESCLSPEDTGQRLGRCNRFGDYDEVCEFTIFSKIKDRTDVSEARVREFRYNTDLSKLWFSYMKKYDKKLITLDEFYIIYNNFHKKHVIQIKTYIKDWYSKSIDHLVKIHPIQYPDFINKKSDTYTAGSNKLRSTRREIFFIVQKHNNKNEYVFDPSFTEEIHKTISETFHEDRHTETQIRNTILFLMNDSRFKYREKFPNFESVSLDTIRDYARRSDTPYPRFDYVYHDVYGIIPKYLLERFKSEM